MDYTEKLMSQARALGEALAADARVLAYRTAQKAAQTDPTTRKLLQDYQTHLNRLHELESNRQPIEVADKQKLREFESRVASDERLKSLMQTQVEYADLMNRVHQAMDEPLAALHDDGDAP